MNGPEVAALKLERTGNVFGIASTEYKVTFPDGTTQSIWSPPWHELDDDEEDAEALKYAERLWAERNAA